PATRTTKASVRRLRFAIETSSYQPIVTRSGCYGFLCVHDRIGQRRGRLKQERMNEHWSNGSVVFAVVPEIPVNAQSLRSRYPSRPPRRRRRLRRPFGARAAGARGWRQPAGTVLLGSVLSVDLSSLRDDVDSQRIPIWSATVSYAGYEVMRPCR